MSFNCCEHALIAGECSVEAKILITDFCKYKINPYPHGRWAKSAFNPNPHCFIAITVVTTCGCKEPLLPHPLHSPVGGGGCYCYGPEDLFNKNVVTKAY
jgi:hypothetical protein